MGRWLAPLTGWLCGTGLVAAGIACLLTRQWAGALLFVYAGGALCAWADWLQGHPDDDAAGQGR